MDSFRYRDAAPVENITFKCQISDICLRSSLAPTARRLNALFFSSRWHFAAAQISSISLITKFILLWKTAQLIKRPTLSPAARRRWDSRNWPPRDRSSGSVSETDFLDQGHIKAFSNPVSEAIAMATSFVMVSRLDTPTPVQLREKRSSRFSTCRGSPGGFWIQRGGGAHRCSA